MARVTNTKRTARTPPAASQPANKKPAPVVVAPIPHLLLTVEEACAALSLRPWKLNNLIQSGQLHSLKVGKLRRVPLWAVEAFARQQQEER